MTTTNINIEEYEEKKALVKLLSQSDYLLNEYQNSLRVTLLYILENGLDEKYVDFLYDYSKLNPQEMNQDQINGIRECLESI